MCTFVAAMMCCYFLQCIQEFSSRLEAATGQTITKFGPMFYVEFTDDRIRLVLPVITPVGWSLICPSHPAVSAH